MKRKKINNSWTEYFNFSTRERRGAIFLACILFIQIGVIYYQLSRSKPVPVPDSKIISSIMKTVTKAMTDSAITETSIIAEEKKFTRFNFDPNLLDEKSWMSLGLSERQIKVIKNYLSRGGRFRIKNDFKKMYCISNDEFNELEPFLLLPDSIEKKNHEPKKAAFEITIVNMEDADSVSLMKLRGIGPILASRIVHYREKLGGFYSMDQLKEVWGINDSLFKSLLPNIVLKNNIPFRFIHLNTDSFGIMAAHPYIKGKIASLICNYRKQHQSFSSIDELKQLPLISEENFLKLAPYLMPD
jgi:competence protein ComEA